VDSRREEVGKKQHRKETTEAKKRSIPQAKKQKEKIAEACNAVSR
jgi:hypothetical protein